MRRAMMDDLRRSRVACTVLVAAMTISALGVCALADTVGLPPITPFEKEWRLHEGKLAGPRFLVARSAKAWAELWKQHALLKQVRAWTKSSKWPKI